MSAKSAHNVDNETAILKSPVNATDYSSIHHEPNHSNNHQNKTKHKTKNEDNINFHPYPALKHNQHQKPSYVPSRKVADGSNLLSNFHEYPSKHLIRRKSTHHSYASVASGSTYAYSGIYNYNYNAVSAVTSFVPKARSNLIQVQIDVTEKPQPIITVLRCALFLLFITFYILLFFDKTMLIAQYVLLFVSLLLSLFYTMIPSYLKIPYLCVWHRITSTDVDIVTATYVVSTKHFRFPLDQATMPVLSVLALIASRKFEAESAWSSMKGESGGILPWAVLGVLFGLCYLCITLDLTGILKALAKKTTMSAEPYPLKLFIYILLFTAALTACTNNDISIICLTPLVISIANSSGVDPEPFIFLVLFASNTFSMLLVTGHAVNLIIETAAHLDYIMYAKLMVVPTLITGCVLLFELYVLFRKKLKAEYHLTDKRDWKESIKLPKYSIFCAVRLFLACISLPAMAIIDGVEFDGDDMAFVLGIAVLSFVIDICVFDIPGHGLPCCPQKQNNNSIKMYLDGNTERDKDIELTAQGRDEFEDPLEHFDSAAHNEQGIVTFGLDALWELPWKLIPFIFSLFILVGFMEDIGLVKVLAETLISVTNGNEWYIMFIVGFAAFALCQCINNQPMTVLLSTVLARAADPSKIDGDVLDFDVQRAAFFALAIGANLGGNGTPVASVAVLLWKGILEKWGLSISYVAFAKRGLVVTPLLVFICLIIVGVEHQYLGLT